MRSHSSLILAAAAAAAGTASAEQLIPGGILNLAHHRAAAAVGAAITPAAQLQGRQQQEESPDFTFDQTNPQEVRCMRRYYSLLTNIPLPTELPEPEVIEGLSSWALDNLMPTPAMNQPVTDLCVAGSEVPVPTSPPALSSFVEEYRGSVSAYLTSIGPEATSIASSCSAAGATGMAFWIEMMVQSDVEGCSSLVQKWTGNADAGPTETQPSDSAVTTGQSTAEQSPTDASESASGSTTDAPQSDDNASATQSSDGASTSTSTGGASRETGFVVAAAAGILGALGIVAAL